MINVLMISTDTKILEEGSVVRGRMIEYGNLFSELHIVVFSKGKNAVVITIAPNVFVYPTNSSSKFLYVKDGISLGLKIIKEKKLVPETSVITTQDPFETGVVGRVLSKNSKIRLHVQIHTDFKSPYFKKNVLNRIRVALAGCVLPRASAIRVVSERILMSLPKNLKERALILPIFADVLAIQNTEVTINLKKKYPQFEKIILIASRLTKEKDIITAIRAFKETLATYPKAGLVIIGSGSEESALKKEVLLLKIGNSVVFESWADHNTLVSYMKSVDVFLSSSLYEGYGLSMLEAHTSGALLVATDAGIAPLLTAPELLIAPRDMKGMVKALNLALGGTLVNRVYAYPYVLKAGYFDMYKADTERVLVNVNRHVSLVGHLLFPFIWALGVFNRSLFIRYVFSGGVAAAIDVILLFVLTEYFHVYYLAAATFAMTISFIARFLLQKFVTFKDTDESQATAQFASYSALYTGSLVATNALLYVFVDYLHVNVVLAQIVTILVIASVSFFVYKFFVFSKEK